MSEQDQQQAPPQRWIDKTDNKIGLGLFGGFAILAAIFIVGIETSGYGEGGGDDPAEPDPDNVLIVDGVAAREQCEGFILPRLKAPSTAEFVGGDVSYPLGPDKPQFAVTGAVDAQNGFGAMIRTEYRCTIDYRADTRQWVVTSLDGFGG